MEYYPFLINWSSNILKIGLYNNVKLLLLTKKFAQISDENLKWRPVKQLYI